MDEHKFLNENQMRARPLPPAEQSKDGGYRACVCLNPAFKAAHDCFDVHFATNSPFGVGLNNLFFIFHFSVGWPRFFFFHETISEKVDPRLR